MNIIGKLTTFLILLFIFSQLYAAKPAKTAIDSDQRVIEMQKDIEGLQYRIKNVEDKLEKINSPWLKLWPILLTAILSFLISFVIYGFKRKDIYREQHLSNLLKYLSSLKPESRPQEDIFFKDLANHRQFVEIYNIFNQLRACEDEINEIYDNWKKEFENHITHLSFEVQLAIEKDEASLEGFVKHWITDCGEYVLKVDFLRDATWRGQPNNAGYGIIGKNKRYLFILGAQNENVVKNLHRQLVDWKVTEAAKKAIDNQKKRLELKSKIRKELESCSHIVKLQDDCKEYLS